MTKGKRGLVDAKSWQFVIVITNRVHKKVGI